MTHGRTLLFWFHINLLFILKSMCYLLRNIEPQRSTIKVLQSRSKQCLHYNPFESPIMLRHDVIYRYYLSNLQYCSDDQCQCFPRLLSRCYRRFSLGYSRDFLEMLVFLGCRSSIPWRILLGN